MVSVGYENGDFLIYDMKTRKKIYEKKLQHGICSIDHNDKHNPIKNILLSKTDGISFFNYEKNSFFEYKTNDNVVWCSKFLPQNDNVFMSSMGSGDLFCFEVEKDSFSLKSKKKLSDSILSGIDWNRDFKGLSIVTDFNRNLKIVIVYDF
jgi:WD repeat-containing protein 92